MGLGLEPRSHTRASRNTARATALLGELAAAPDFATTLVYAAPPAGARPDGTELASTAWRAASAKDYSPHTPYARHALISATAAVAEADGDHRAAGEGFAGAAERWEKFGVVPEHAHALQGRGRCLIALGQPHEAAPLLRQARALFGRLGAAPALGAARRPARAGDRTQLLEHDRYGMRHQMTV